jgi:hypothetical protein
MGVWLTAPTAIRRKARGEFVVPALTRSDRAVHSAGDDRVCWECVHESPQLRGEVGLGPSPEGRPAISPVVRRRIRTLSLRHAVPKEGRCHITAHSHRRTQILRVGLNPNSNQRKSLVIRQFLDDFRSK